MERRTILRIEFENVQMLYLSLVNAPPPGHGIVSGPLARVLMTRSGSVVYYMHDGSMLSMAVDVSATTSGHINVRYCDDMTCLMGIVRCIRLPTNLTLAHTNNKAVIEAVQEYFEAERYAPSRARVLRLDVVVPVWGSVLQYIFDNPECLPELFKLVIEWGGGTADRCFIPVRAGSLMLKSVGRIDADCVRETVANAVGVEILDMHADVVDCAHETVRSVTATCGVFAGRFPNLKTLYLNGKTERIDLTHCPRIERVVVEGMSPELYTNVLTTAPHIPTRPMDGNYGVHGWERLIAEVHALHLVPQIVASGGAYKWAPPVHRSFNREPRANIEAFVMGMMRLMEAGEIAAFDPAMLEEALREIPTDILTGRWRRGGW